MRRSAATSGEVNCGACGRCAACGAAGAGAAPGTPWAKTGGAVMAISSKTWRIANPLSLIRDPESLIVNPASFIVNPPSCIVHPASGILHPASLRANAVGDDRRRFVGGHVGELVAELVDAAI